MFHKSTSNGRVDRRSPNHSIEGKYLTIHALYNSLESVFENPKIQLTWAYQLNTKSWIFRDRLVWKFLFSGSKNSVMYSRLVAGNYSLSEISFLFLIALQMSLTDGVSIVFVDVSELLRHPPILHSLLGTWGFFVENKVHQWLTFPSILKAFGIFCIAWMSM